MNKNILMTLNEPSPIIQEPMLDDSIEKIELPMKFKVITLLEALALVFVPFSIIVALVMISLSDVA